MLTKESQELEYVREELFFYSNQCLSEVRRVGQDNGLLLTDHFITMSQIQCAYINQVSRQKTVAFFYTNCRFSALAPCDVGRFLESL